MPITHTYIQRQASWLISEATMLFTQWRAGSLSGWQLGMALLTRKARMMEMVDQLTDLTGSEKKTIVMGAWDAFQEWCVEHDNPYIPDGVEAVLDNILASDYADKAIEILYGLAKGIIPGLD